MDPTAVSERIKTKGLELGFSHVGIIPCHDYPEYAKEVASRPDYKRFVDNPASFYAGCFPSRYYPQGRSVVCATYGYSGIDYPEGMLAHIGRIYLARCYVPTPESIAGRRVAAMAEYLEGFGMDVFDNSVEFPARPAAVEAGVVRYGDNNFVRTEEDGSFVVIYVWLIDAELAYDAPLEPQPCPDDCRLCVKACPTGALEGPRRLNPMRCILMNDLLVPMKPGMEDVVGQHIHGCDICQAVCPRNHEVLSRPKRKDPFLEKLAEKFSLERILLMEGFDDDYYEDVVRPIMYNYIRDVDVFRRNAAVAMGNSGDVGHLPALRRAVELFPGTATEDAARRAISKLESAALA